MKPHGCHNQPRSEGYWAKNGIDVFHGTGVQRMKWIEDVMSKECNYSKHKTDDPMCDGCKDKA